MFKAHDPFFFVVVVLAAPRGQPAHLPASFDPLLLDHGPGFFPGERRTPGREAKQRFDFIAIISSLGAEIPWARPPVDRPAFVRAGSQGALPFHTHRISRNHSRQMRLTPGQSETQAICSVGPKAQVSSFKASERSL